MKVSSQGLRREQKGFGIDFHSIVLLNLFKAGWKVSWCYITTGGVNLDSPKWPIVIKYRQPTK